MYFMPLNFATIFAIILLHYVNNEFVRNFGPMLWKHWNVSLFFKQVSKNDMQNILLALV